MEIKKLLESIDNETVKSAWDKGVKLYAYELVEALEVKTVEEITKEVLLNGADNWSSFSYGGCSLIYDCNIAERLSTPSELKKNKGGENQPNKNETWLDCQTRALTQAYRKIMTHKRNLTGKGWV